MVIQKIIQVYYKLLMLIFEKILLKFDITL